MYIMENRRLCICVWKWKKLQRRHGHDHTKLFWLFFDSLLRICPEKERKGKTWQYTIIKDITGFFDKQIKIYGNPRKNVILKMVEVYYKAW